MNEKVPSKPRRRLLGLAASVLMGVGGLAAVAAVQAPAPAKPAPAPAVGALPATAYPIAIIHAQSGIRW